MKRWLFSSLLLLFFHVAAAQQKDMIVNSFFEQVNQGSWETARGYMDANMLKSVTAFQLKTLWEGIEKQFGKWEAFTSQRTGRQGEYNLVFADNSFSHGQVTFRVALNNDHKIAGFFIEKVSTNTMALNRNEMPDSISTPDGILYGTLLQPDGKRNVPVVLIIAGSGPTDRNGNTYLIQPKDGASYQQLAEGLAANGIASLRYDKRLTGESNHIRKAMANTTIDDLVADAVAWIDHLERSGQFANVAVIGHSEGALIGMLVAQKRSLKCLVSLAGPGETLDKILLAQLKPRLPDSLFRQTMAITSDIKKEETPAGVPAGLKQLFNPDVYTFLHSTFLYDPCKLLSVLQMPVLIINGTADVQVPPAQAELLHRCKPDARLVLIPGMPHSLKDNRVIPDGTKALPLAPELLPPIIALIKN